MDEEVEQLLSRVSESNIPEERTEALSQLRDIAFDSVEVRNTTNTPTLYSRPSYTT